MMCTKCGKKEASVYYKQIINGKVTEMNLCEDCAAELRKKTDAEFGSFWKGFGEMNLLAPFFGLRPSSRLGSGRTCPVCGATYRDFAESGKAGCSKCYEVFSDELGDTIEGIHGKREHIGKIPKHLGSRISREKKIEKLKEKLSIAVGKQEFEEAAKLRDEIQSLEKEEKEKDA